METKYTVFDAPLVVHGTTKAENAGRGKTKRAVGTLLVACASALSSLSASAVTNALERLHVNAYADVETAYWARGVIVDRNPYSAQYIDASVDLDPFGKIGGYAWSVSSMSRSGQGATRRNAYNEVDYGAYYAYTLRLTEGWGIGNFVGPKWVTLPGYRPHAHTINEWNVSQWLENPYVTPYYLLRYAYHGQQWCYWDVGLKRSWEVYDRLTFTAQVFAELGDGRHLAAQYGANPDRRDGAYSGGIMALNVLLRLDYALTDWLGVFAFVHQFDTVSSDGRDALKVSDSPETLGDLTIGGVGISLNF